MATKPIDDLGKMNSDVLSEFDIDVEPPHTLGRTIAAPVKGVANILGKTASYAVSGVTNEIKSRFPETAGLAQEAMGVVDDIKSLKDDVTGELKPAWNTIKGITLKMMPMTKLLMPKSLYSKIEKKLKESYEPEDERSEQEKLNEARTENINQQLSAIFSAQMEMNQMTEAKASAEKQTDRLLQRTHFKADQAAFASLDKKLAAANNFLSGAFTAYMKKSLELKYRHLYVANDTFNVLRTLTKITEARLEEIKHNTGLPEYAKTTFKERLVGSMKQKAADSIVSWGSKLKDKFFGDLKERVMDDIKTFTRGILPSVASMSGMFSDPSMVGGPLRISDLIGHALGFFTGLRTRKKTSDMLDKKAGHIGDIEKSSQMLAKMLPHLIHGKLEELKMNTTNPVLQYILDQLPSKNISTKIDTQSIMKDPNAVVPFDVSTRAAITQVIPSHLERIGDYVEGLSKYIAPDLKLENKTFNYVTQRLSSVKEFQHDLEDQMFSEERRASNLEDSLATTMGLAKDNKATASLEKSDDIKELAKKMNVKGKFFDSEQFRKLQQKVITNMMANQKYFQWKDISDYLIGKGKSEWFKVVFKGLTEEETEAVCNYYKSLCAPFNKPDETAINKLVEISMNVLGDSIIDVEVRQQYQRLGAGRFDKWTDAKTGEAVNTADFYNKRHIDSTGLYERAEYVASSTEEERARRKEREKFNKRRDDKETSRRRAIMRDSGFGVLSEVLPPEVIKLFGDLYTKVAKPVAESIEKAKNTFVERVTGFAPEDSFFSQAVKSSKELVKKALKADAVDIVDAYMLNSNTLHLVYSVKDVEGVEKSRGSFDVHSASDDWEPATWDEVKEAWEQHERKELHKKLKESQYTTAVKEFQKKGSDPKAKSYERWRRERKKGVTGSNDDIVRASDAIVEKAMEEEKKKSSTATTTEPADVWDTMKAWREATIIDIPSKLQKIIDMMVDSDIFLKSPKHGSSDPKNKDSLVVRAKEGELILNIDQQKRLMELMNKTRGEDNKLKDQIDLMTALGLNIPDGYQKQFSKGGRVGGKKKKKLISEDQERENRLNILNESIMHVRTIDTEKQDEVDSGKKKKKASKKTKAIKPSTTTAVKVGGDISDAVDTVEKKGKKLVSSAKKKLDKLGNTKVGKAVKGRAKKVWDTITSWFDGFKSTIMDKEAFLDKFPKSFRGMIGRTYDAVAKGSNNIGEYFSKVAKDLKLDKATKSLTDSLTKAANTITDPTARRHFIIAATQQMINVKDTIGDPKKRDKALKKAKEDLNKLAENLKKSKPKDRPWYHKPLVKAKLLWRKIKQSRIGKWLGSFVDKETKDKFKADFGKVKESIQSGWGDLKKALHLDILMNKPEEKKQEESKDQGVHQNKNGRWIDAKGHFVKAPKKEEEKSSTTEEKKEEPKKEESKTEQKKPAEKSNDTKPTVAETPAMAEKDIDLFSGDTESQFHSDFRKFANKVINILRKGGFGKGGFGLGRLLGGAAKGVGSALGGIGKAYLGALRGAGSVIGGVAKGAGKALSGLANSGIPSALIRGTGSLMGGLAKGYGTILGGTFRGIGAGIGGIAKGVGSLFGRKTEESSSSTEQEQKTSNIPPGIHKNKAGRWVDEHGKFVKAPEGADQQTVEQAEQDKSFLDRLGNVGTAIKKIINPTKEKYVDIYLKDQVEPGNPILSAKQQEDGVQFEDGTKVESSADITKPVFMKKEGSDHPQCVISSINIKHGLVDVNNEPISKGLIGGLLDKAGWAGKILKVGGKIGKGLVDFWGGIFGGLFGDKDKEKSKSSKSFFGRMFGFDGKDFSEFHNSVITRLDKIITIMGGEPPSPEKKEETSTKESKDKEVKETKQKAEKEKKKKETEEKKKSEAKDKKEKAEKKKADTEKKKEEKKVQEAEKKKTFFQRAKDNLVRVKERAKEFMERLKKQKEERKKELEEKKKKQKERDAINDKAEKENEERLKKMNQKRTKSGWGRSDRGDRRGWLQNITDSVIGRGGMLRNSKASMLLWARSHGHKGLAKFISKPGATSKAMLSTGFTRTKDFLGAGAHKVGGVLGKGWTAISGPSVVMGADGKLRDKLTGKFTHDYRRDIDDDLLGKKQALQPYLNSVKQQGRNIKSIFSSQYKRNAAGKLYDKATGRLVKADALSWGDKLHDKLGTAGKFLKNQAIRQKDMAVKQAKWLGRVAKGTGQYAQTALNMYGSGLKKAGSFIGNKLGPVGNFLGGKIGSAAKLVGGKAGGLLSKAMPALGKFGGLAKAGLAATKAGWAAGGLKGAALAGGKGLLALATNPVGLAILGTAAAGLSLYKGIKGASKANTKKNLGIKEGVQVQDRLASGLSQAFTFGLGGKRAAKFTRKMLDYTPGMHLIKAFMGDKDAMTDKEIQKFRLKCENKIKKGMKGYDTILAKFNKAVRMEDWPTARAISGNETSLAKNLLNAIPGVTLVTDIGKGIGNLLFGNDEKPMTVGEIKAFRSKMQAKIAKKDKVAEKLLEKFNDAVAEQDWKKARQLSDKKTTGLLNGVSAGRNIAAIAGLALGGPLGMLAGAIVGDLFDDPNKKPLSKKEIEETQKFLTKQSSYNPKAKELLKQFNDAVEGGDWKTARKLSSKEGRHLITKIAKGVGSTLRVIAGVGTLGLTELFIPSDQNKPMTEKEIMDFRKKMQFRIKKGDGMASRKLEAFDEAIAQQKWEKARKIAKLPVEQTYQKVGKVLNSIGRGALGVWTLGLSELFMPNDDDKPLKDEEIVKFRESMQRKIKMGDKSAQRKLDAFEDAVGEQKWKRARAIAKLPNEGTVKKFWKGVGQGIANLFGSDDQAMSEMDIKKVRDELQDKIKSGDKSAQKKLDAFDDAVSDQNWKRARKIANTPNKNIISKAKEAIDNFLWFGNQDEPMTQAEIEKFEDEMQAKIKKGDVGAQKLLDRFHDAVANQLWSKARKLSGAQKDGILKSAAKFLGKGLLRSVTFGLFGKDDATADQVAKLEEEIQSKVDDDESGLWQKVYDRFVSYKHQGMYNEAYEYGNKMLSSSLSDLKQNAKENKNADEMEAEVRAKKRQQDVIANIQKSSDKFSWWTSPLKKTKLALLLRRAKYADEVNDEYLDQLEEELHSIDEEADTTKSSASYDIDKSLKKMMQAQAKLRDVAINTRAKISFWKHPFDWRNIRKLVDETTNTTPDELTDEKIGEWYERLSSMSDSGLKKMTKADLKKQGEDMQKKKEQGAGEEEKKAADKAEETKPDQASKTYQVGNVTVKKGADGIRTTSVSPTAGKAITKMAKGVLIGYTLVPNEGESKEDYEKRRESLANAYAALKKKTPVYSIYTDKGRESYIAAKQMKAAMQGGTYDENKDPVLLALSADQSKKVSSEDQQTQTEFKSDEKKSIFGGLLSSSKNVVSGLWSKIKDYTSVSKDELVDKAKSVGKSLLNFGKKAAPWAAGAAFGPAGLATVAGYKASKGLSNLLFGNKDDVSSPSNNGFRYTDPKAFRKNKISKMRFKKYLRKNSANIVAGVLLRKSGESEDEYNNRLSEIQKVAIKFGRKPPISVLTKEGKNNVKAANAAAKISADTANAAQQEADALANIHSGGPITADDSNDDDESSTKSSHRGWFDSLKDRFGKSSDAQKSDTNQSLPNDKSIKSSLIKTGVRRSIGDRIGYGMGKFRVSFDEIVEAIPKANKGMGQTTPDILVERAAGIALKKKYGKKYTSSFFRRNSSRHAALMFVKDNALSGKFKYPDNVKSNTAKYTRTVNGVVTDNRIVNTNPDGSDTTSQSDIQNTTNKPIDSSTVNKSEQPNDKLEEKPKGTSFFSKLSGGVKSVTKSPFVKAGVAGLIGGPVGLAAYGATKGLSWLNNKYDITGKIKSGAKSIWNTAKGIMDNPYVQAGASGLAAGPIGLATYGVTKGLSVLNKKFDLTGKAKSIGKSVFGSLFGSSKTPDSGSSGDNNSNQTSSKQSSVSKQTKTPEEWDEYYRKKYPNFYADSSCFAEAMYMVNIPVQAIKLAGEEDYYAKRAEIKDHYDKNPGIVYPISCSLWSAIWELCKNKGKLEELYDLTSEKFSPVVNQDFDKKESNQKSTGFFSKLTGGLKSAVKNPWVQAGAAGLIGGPAGLAGYGLAKGASWLNKKFGITDKIGSGISSIWGITKKLGGGLWDLGKSGAKKLWNGTKKAVKNPWVQAGAAGLIGGPAGLAGYGLAKGASWLAGKIFGGSKSNEGQAVNTPSAESKKGLTGSYTINGFSVDPSLNLKIEDIHSEVERLRKEDPEMYGNGQNTSTLADQAVNNLLDKNPKYDKLHSFLRRNIAENRKMMYLKWYQTKGNKIEGTTFTYKKTVNGKVVEPSVSGQPSASASSSKVATNPSTRSDQLDHQAQQAMDRHQRTTDILEQGQKMTKNAIQESNPEESATNRQTVILGRKLDKLTDAVFGVRDATIDAGEGTSKRISAAQNTALAQSMAYANSAIETTRPKPKEPGLKPPSINVVRPVIA